ncbi:MAG: NAD-binding protein [Alphaproteobacteria bacterium]|nr:NAD-binding protein [Alphaproteobacteria bacterium]
MAASTKAAVAPDGVLKSASMFRTRDWIILAPLAVLAVALGFWGFSSACEPVGATAAGASSMPSCADPWQRLMKSFTLLHGGSYMAPWQLVVAEFLLPAVALFGGAKLILINLSRDMRVAMARRYREHTIVCGLGDTGRNAVENIQRAGSDVVAVTLDTDAPNALACERLRVPVLRGDVTQLGVLHLAGLHKARSLILTCGSDAVNLEVALRVDEARSRQSPGRRLYVMPEIRSHWLLDLMQTHRSATLGSEAVEFRPFDLYANAARLLLRWPVFAQGPGAAAARPHLLLAGLGELGTQIILHAVQTTFALPGRRLAVTVFDQQGKDTVASLAGRFAGLTGLADIELVESSFDADDPSSWSAVWAGVDQSLDQRADGTTTVAAIVALSEDKDSLHAAVQFRERFDRLGELRTPVFVRLQQQRRLGHFAATLDGSDMLIERLTPFGDLRFLTSPELLLDQKQDQLARAVHAVYIEKVEPGDRPNDPARQPWNRLPELFKQSNRRFADHIPVKLRLLGLRPVEGSGPVLTLKESEADLLATAEHWRWTVERRCLGWEHGPVYDPLRLRHDLLVAWDELPAKTQEDNRRMVRAIPEMLAAADMSLRRERIMSGLPGDIAVARAALAGLDATELPLLIFDPADPESWHLARDAVANSGAKLWQLWRDRPKLTEMAQPKEIEAVKNAIETSITAAELAGLPLPPSREALQQTMSVAG